MENRNATPQMKELEPISRYRMDDMEAKAFKISLIWQEECSRELPGEQHEKIKEGKDPRKSILFKYCYKMAKETNGIVADRDARLYVRAQIQILKSIRDGKVHALIGPHCLVGEKAWKRWKFWKRIYDKQMSTSLSGEELGIRTKERIIELDLKRTFSLMESKGLNDSEKYMSSLEDIVRWSSTGEISPFYFLLSPRFKRFFGEGMIPVDKALHGPSITPRIENMFRERFSHEFD